MLNSVGEHIAGEEVDLDDSLSDRYVLLGYAEGKLSRDYDPDELNEIGTTVQVAQVVSLGG